jgi:DNA-binding beta-propeller fold protein YncE
MPLLSYPAVEGTAVIRFGSLVLCLIIAVSHPRAPGAGDVYVANLRGNDVSYYDAASGEFKGVFVAAGAGGLSHPTGLAFGPDGNLYVGSSGNDRILRYSGDTGEFMDVFVDDEHLERPFSLIFGPAGHLYVSSGSQNIVLRYGGGTGDFLNIAASAPQLQVPIGLAFGPDRMLYVANGGGHNVLRFDPQTGALLDVFAEDSLRFPSDLVFGDDGLLYVSSAFTSNVVRFDGTTGAFVDILGTLPDQGAPMGLVFGDRMPGGSGPRLFVGDFARSRLYWFEAGGGHPTLGDSVGLAGPENIAVKPRS